LFPRKSGEIYLHADRLEFTASGLVIFWQVESLVFNVST